MNHLRQIFARSLSRNIWYCKSQVVIKNIYEREELDTAMNGSTAPFVLFISVKALKENQKIPRTIQSYYKKQDMLALEKEQQEAKQIGEANSISQIATTEGEHTTQSVDQPDDGAREPTTLLSIKQEESVDQCNIIYYETDDLNNMKQIFGMSKLPCAYLINNGQIIDCELTSHPGRRPRRAYQPFHQDVRHAGQDE